LAISRLKPQLKAIGWVTLLQTVLVFCGTAAGVALFYTVASRLGFQPIRLAAGLTSFELVAAALILALVATANSPASTVAVIDEERARGPLATLGLGVTVLKDVVVIILMAVTLSVTANLMDPQESFAGTLVLAILFELTVSIGLGALLGGLIIAYLARINRELGLFLLVVVLLTIEAGSLIESQLRFHLHFLVVCVVAGFVVENLSVRGDHLIRALKKSSLPVYVIFFTLTGVGVDLDAVALLWPLALGFAVWRALLLFASTWMGARVAGEPAAIRESGWTPFVTQAGVSLGLAELVAASYPGIGIKIRTLVLAVVALNQLVGPVLFKWSLRGAGARAARPTTTVGTSPPSRPAGTARRRRVVGPAASWRIHGPYSRPGSTTENSPDPTPGTHQRTVLLDRLSGVAATGGLESTSHPSLSQCG
jgi:Kef-type K+ transport system membrane component KefB